MPERTIDFYYDYISHNAYLAWHRLPDIAARHDVAIRCLPALFAGFLKAYGQLGPAEVEPKLRWMNRNNLRKCVQLGIPFNAPARHPFNPLLLLRLTAQAMPEERRAALTGHLLRAVWVDSVDAGDAAAVRGYLRDAGVDAEPLFAAIETPETKAAVRANTDEAIARGAFGVPTMIVGDEVFWGNDDLEYLDLYLAGRDPLASVDSAAFAAGWERARAGGHHRQRS